MPDEFVLALEHVTHAVERLQVEDLSLELRPGEALAVVGPAHAGKTDFLRLCAAQTPPAQAPAAPAPAAKPDDTPSIRVGATLFADYTYTQSPEATDADGNTYKPSQFNVGRSYINITGNISHLVAFRRVVVEQHQRFDANV